MDTITLDTIFRAGVYAFIFWGVGLYLTANALSSSSSRISIVVSTDTEKPLDEKPESQKERPFHVILIDLAMAAQENKIHCIEKPLDDEELDFVALSYRCGQVPETVVDTHIGVASIVAFDLHDFYRLCKYITQEPELQHIKYIWVDAICVNDEQRQATIYRMTEIYERANTIVAVPDLHLHSVASFKTNEDILAKTLAHSMYLYHLIQDNSETLKQLEENWLDRIHVPKDPALRQMLNTVTHFVDGLMPHHVHALDYGPDDAVAHVQAAAGHYRQWQWRGSIQDVHAWDPIDTGETEAFKYPYVQDPPSEPSVPFAWLHLTLAEMKNDQWKDMVANRNRELEQSIRLLIDLILDWSSRTWVVSEYSMARTKGKMKFWFVQLDHAALLGLPFFDFDFTTTRTLTRPLAQKLYDTLTEQLQPKTMVEKMLLSKTSRNKDRFSAIFAAEYKEVVPHEWGVTTLLSVKLKLYEVLTTEDKLELLFLSSPKTGMPTFPTFATTDLDQNLYKRHYVDVGAVTTPVNFDGPDPIILTGKTLQLRPTMYYVLDKTPYPTRFDSFRATTKDLWENFGIDTETLVIVCIPMTEDGLTCKNAYNLAVGGGAFIQLIGNFEKNTWIFWRNLDCYMVPATIKSGAWSTHRDFTFMIY